jgi:hypothetical protein
VNRMVRFPELIIGLIFVSVALWVMILLSTDASRAERSDRLLKEEQEASKVGEELKRYSRLLEGMPHPDPWAPPGVADKPPYPNVALSERVFDFGQIPVGTTATHRFRVRNVGKARLVIYKPPTNCGNSNYWHRAIEPGGSIDIELSWNARVLDPIFSKIVCYRTNDPREPELTLKVCGKVALPRTFHLDGVIWMRDNGQSSVLQEGDPWAISSSNWTKTCRRSSPRSGCFLSQRRRFRTMGTSISRPRGSTVSASWDRARLRISI